MGKAAEERLKLQATFLVNNPAVGIVLTMFIVPYWQLHTINTALLDTPLTQFKPVWLYALFGILMGLFFALGLRTLGGICAAD